MKVWNLDGEWKIHFFFKYFLSTHIPPPAIMFYGYGYVVIKFVTVLSPHPRSRSWIWPRLVIV